MSLAAARSVQPSPAASAARAAGVAPRPTSARPADEDRFQALLNEDDGHDGVSATGRSRHQPPRKGGPADAKTPAAVPPDTALGSASDPASGEAPTAAALQPLPLFPTPLPADPAPGDGSGDDDLASSLHFVPPETTMGQGGRATGLAASKTGLNPLNTLLQPAGLATATPGGAISADASAAQTPSAPGGAAKPAPATASKPLLEALQGTGATLVQAGVVAATPSANAAAAASVLNTAARGKGVSSAEPDKMAVAFGAQSSSAAFPPIAPVEAPVSPVFASGQADGGETSDDAPDPNDGASSGDGTAAEGADAAAFGIAAPSGQASSASAATGPQSGAVPLSATAADLAAQMAAQAAARASTAGASRFKLQLNPYGLGQVDVTVSIGQDRSLTASLRFADASTAKALSAHAGELQDTLAQAGFTLPAGGIDFSSMSSVGGLAAQAGGAGVGGQSSGGDTERDSGGEGAGYAQRGPASRAFAAGERMAGGSGLRFWAGGDAPLDLTI